MKGEDEGASTSGPDTRSPMTYDELLTTTQAQTALHSKEAWPLHWLRGSPDSQHFGHPQCHALQHLKGSLQGVRAALSVDIPELLPLTD